MIREIINNITPAAAESLFNLFNTSLMSTKYYSSAPGYRTDPDLINVFIIRCNPIYVTNDINRNNDWMFIIQNPGRLNPSHKKYIFQVTVDPKIKKNGIANSLPQQYLGNIRNHRWIPGRPAICQDNHKVWVRRYNKMGFYEEAGYFGINIHNNAGLFNSSLGCTILASENSYSQTFKPLLNSLKKLGIINKIPVTIMQDETFIDLMRKI
jgi:hypothetical protein